MRGSQLAQYARYALVGHLNFVFLVLVCMGTSTAIASVAAMFEVLMLLACPPLGLVMLPTMIGAIVTAPYWSWTVVLTALMLDWSDIEDMMLQLNSTFHFGSDTELQELLQAIRDFKDSVQSQ